VTICEYDGTVLPGPAPEGACPTCEADAEEHALHCKACRENPNLPDRGGLDLSLMLRQEVHQ
jgi:hypothetical protein